MTVRDVYNVIDGLFPFDMAEDFDNVGLLVGDMDAVVTDVAVVLDCTEKTVQTAKNLGAQLIVTHHPVIFEPLKALPKASVPYRLAQNGISVISAHTNFDRGVNGVNDLLCKALGFNTFEKLFCADGWEGRMCTFSEEKTPKEVADLAKRALNTPVKFTANKNVKKLAIFSGSAGGYIYDAVKCGADGILCGDIKHNIFVDSVNMGVCAFDAGHYSTESIAMAPLCEMLKSKLNGVKIHHIVENGIEFV